ncbi:tetratricopeptide repeat protein [Caulobacter sp. 17J80-11]|uniref:tetratricopeptide repeat protein n=1 Tax=Caulobacter sp. 17J80-11 TaxID=2763502 RepID=UPI0016539BD0|nr:tetratricopeptide repeat protein [Caulobacter sp. 17J80-11]MBC6980594.1 tetratricopeptide repeat protein [Caulobacter sp. 17J80-11]
MAEHVLQRRTSPDPAAASALPDARPAVVRPAGGAVGDAASPEALDRLEGAVASLKQQASIPWLRQALSAIQQDDWKNAAEHARKALDLDPGNGFGWWLLAIACDKGRDLMGALECYEKAVALLPELPELANDLGRLAFQLGQMDVAEKLFLRFLAGRPGDTDGVNNLACALRDQERYGDAVDVLRPAIYANPEAALLWNTLGTVLNEIGDMAEAVTFYDEALRLEPTFAKASYNRANSRVALGDVAGALADMDDALPGMALESERAMTEFGRSTILISSGDLAAGWDAYEARFDPHFADAVQFVCEAPRWSPDQDLAGKRLLVYGEQGLGDEVMFANVLPDLIEALGPEGSLVLLVEHRLVALFQRSFPGAEVGTYSTFRVNHRLMRGSRFLETVAPVDAWTTLATPLRRFRRSVGAFPNRERYLQADPGRVEHWRRELAAAGDGPKAGLLWKSLKLTAARRRYFSPFEQWRPVLETPGVRFVNLQYGDCAEELEQARAAGFEIWNPPGINLKDDLDDVAALCCALDLVIGPANATTNIAAACGAPVWLVSTPDAWPKLGTDRYPWYPQARVFNPPAYNQWTPVMAELAGALRTAF